MMFNFRCILANEAYSQMVITSKTFQGLFQPRGPQEVPREHLVRAGVERGGGQHRPPHQDHVHPHPRAASLLAHTVIGFQYLFRRRIYSNVYVNIM